MVCLLLVHAKSSFLAFLASVAGDADPEGFRATSLRRVARCTDGERVRVVAKVRERSSSSSSSAIDRMPVPDIAARGASKLSLTTDQQTVQAICASARLLYERSVRPAYALDTLSTGYQRPPQPRLRARSWPRLCLTATTTPMAQDTLAREVECLISHGCLHLTKGGFLHGYLLPLAPARRMPSCEMRRREA